MRIGHGLGNLTKARVAPRGVEVPCHHERLWGRLSFAPGLKICEAGPPVRRLRDARWLRVNCAQHDITSRAVYRDDRLVKRLSRPMEAGSVRVNSNGGRLRTMVPPASWLVRPTDSGSRVSKPATLSLSTAAGVISTSTNTSTRCSRSRHQRVRVRLAVLQVRTHDDEVVAIRRHHMAHYRWHSDRGADSQQDPRRRRDPPSSRDRSDHHENSYRDSSQRHHRLQHDHHANTAVDPHHPKERHSENYPGPEKRGQQPCPKVAHPRHPVMSAIPFGDNTVGARH